jgi:argininosuccinate synthase
MSKKIILAYSGGLDTSVAIRWLAEKYRMDVIALTINIGGMTDLEPIRQKALKVGAIKAITMDATELFVKSYIFPALQANSVYEEQYPLATALGRPLIAKLMVDVAKSEKAVAVAHGSTVKEMTRFVWM